MDDERVEFHVRGPFRVQAPGGADITPRGSKLRGLLLLLLTSTAGKRARVWIQDKLWSDRGREQGAASLRQALVQIRKAFGAHRGVLAADRLDVALNLGRIRLCEDGTGEFAEGIDVRDQEFEHWLLTERARRPGPEDAPAAGRAAWAPAVPLPSRPWTIVVRAGNDPRNPSWWVEQLVADGVVLSLRETFNATVHRNGHRNGAAAAEGPAWVVDLASFSPDRRRFGIRAALSEQGSGHQLWSGYRIVRRTDAPPVEHPDILQFTNALVAAVADGLLAGEGRLPGAVRADLRCCAAIRRLFLMKPDEVKRADETFAEAFEIAGRGTYLGWRAQVRTIQRIKRYRDALDDLREEGARFAARALQLAPRNSVVLAALANTRLFLEGDVAGGHELAARSARINPANPMAWWALSSAQLYSGAVDAACENAARARHLAGMPSATTCALPFFVAPPAFRRGNGSAAFGCASRVAGSRGGAAPGFSGPAGVADRAPAQVGQRGMIELKCVPPNCA
ncbi:hypothetical protein [Actibacterium sp. MT2.3-13A]|uniref:tetratricopeptide repeat protein n=1 Tax=Actibacterium sp. MT2.3-13A TaxID=2828332 RepID=UPI001BA68CCE|nr:hypothetical protein [Actibacterium sp. MT2.3-13A]